MDYTEFEERYYDEIEKEFCKLVRFDYQSFKDRNDDWKDMIKGITDSAYKQQHYPYYLKAVENIRVGLLPEVVVYG